jgi:hypothetical protein
MNTLLSRVGGGGGTGPSGAPGEPAGGSGDDEARLVAAVSEFWKRLAMEAQTPLGHVCDKVRGSALRDDLASKERLLERLVQLRKSVSMADDELARLEEQRRASHPATATASPGAAMADAAPQPPLSPTGPKSPPGVDIPARRAMLLATEKRLDALTRRLDSMRERLEIVSGIEERVQSATVAAAAASSAAEAGSGPGRGLGLGPGSGPGPGPHPRPGPGGPARSHGSPVQASPPKRGLLQGLSAAALAISSGGSAGKGEASSPPPTESLPLGIGQALDSALLDGDLDIDAYVESLSGLATSFSALKQQGRS